MEGKKGSNRKRKNMKKTKGKRNEVTEKQENGVKLGRKRYE